MKGWAFFFLPSQNTLNPSQYSAIGLFGAQLIGTSAAVFSSSSSLLCCYSDLCRDLIESDCYSETDQTVLLSVVR